MQELTLELAPEIYRRLREEAEHLGETPQAVARQWLTERLAAPAPTAGSDREKARQALADAGLLAELGPNLRWMALCGGDESTGQAHVLTERSTLAAEVVAVGRAEVELDHLGPGAAQSQLGMGQISNDKA